MNERERWIVYPLLFLALGAALRDKMFDQTTTRRIVCQELTVIDEEPVGLRPVRVLAKIGRADGTPSGAPPVGYLYVAGQVEVDGPVIARQFGTPGGPMVVSPGVSAADLFRAVQQMVQAAMQDAKPEAEEPAAAPGEPAAEAESPADAVPATDPSPAENSP